MEREELAGWLRLTLTPGIGNTTARRLLAAFGLPAALFSQSAAALRPFLSDGQIQAAVGAQGEGDLTAALMSVPLAERGR